MRTQLGLTLAVSVSMLGVVDATRAQPACRVAKISASDGFPFDSFGRDVGVSGDTLLSGAFWDNDNGADSGSAYIFRFDEGSWGETQKQLASDGQTSDTFGRALALDGNVAMIGSLQHTHDDRSGAVYVFEWDGTTWAEQQELLASDGVVGDGFGISVEIDGELAVIGAPGDDDNATNSGSAYIFRRDANNGQWIEEQKLLASDGGVTDSFGWSVGISGDRAVIGAIHATCRDDVTSAGAAYVFRFCPTDSAWIEEQKLTASDCALNDDFGGKVSISNGDRILVGDRLDNDNGVFSGSAFVFRFDRDSSTWIEEQKLVASDGKTNDQFGRSVAIDGNTALIGAEFVDDVGSDAGAAYLFRFDGRNWIEQQKLLPDPGPTSFFGVNVDVEGDTAVVGAHGEDSQRGAAYVFAGLSGIDCNGNDRSDACDILFGFSNDVNGSGVPDECECLWDLDGDGIVGIVDFLNVLAAWGPNPGDPADFDGSGTVDIMDFLALLANWGPCL